MIRSKIVFAFLFSVLLSCNQSKKIHIRVLDETTIQKLDKATVVNVNSGEKVNQVKEGIYVLPAKKNDWVNVYCPGYDTAKFKIAGLSQEYFVPLKPLSN